MKNNLQSRSVIVSFSIALLTICCPSYAQIASPEVQNTAKKIVYRSKFTDAIVKLYDLDSVSKCGNLAAAAVAMQITGKMPIDNKVANISYAVQNEIAKYMHVHFIRNGMPSSVYDKYFSSYTSQEITSQLVSHCQSLVERALDLSK